MLYEKYVLMIYEFIFLVTKPLHVSYKRKMLMTSIKSLFLNLDLITMCFLNGKLLTLHTISKKICIQLLDKKVSLLSMSYKHIK